jgi:preprotein translocase subunit SecD
VKNLYWRTSLILAVMIAAAVYVLPTFKPGVWPHKKINLGLDLQGGMHLVLEVDTEKALEGALERRSLDIRELLKKERIRYEEISRQKNEGIRVSVANTENIEAFKKLLTKELSDLEQNDSSKADDLFKVFLTIPSAEADQIKSMATSQALETIRNRIDQFGVSEPDIRSQGDNRILIQLPGVKDTKRAKDLIGKTAQLEFKLVDEVHSLDAARSGSVPPGSELAEPYSETPGEKSTPYLLKKQTLLTGADLKDARVEFDSQFNEPYVSIEFNRKGARIFEQVTGENVKKRLAIVLDNKVHTAPVIQEKIAGGQARITGSYTLEEAKDLAIVLRAGALPAPVKVLEERTVGPSLGTDSINTGLLSMIIGFAIVVVFMAIYYMGAGLIANLALVLNILLIAGGLAAFGATLTLPGIAGIILTIGMAVDANVLVYERIREELDIGKSAHAAVDAGYERATLTILDANVTTLIAALVLFQFGTGAVKGFAVTLSLGVVASVFTALIVSRVIFDFFLLNRKIKQLSI